ncbi:hypothetical protein A2662_01510 [Candidatus Giovannonibacteria bacterium RIFCSPHIGHO2_01_FULL_45_33]|uniref:Uncharacterized protein n=1 Tax=Candidatus Giovannonibacteria bacterium RIFCSPLOWO2_01_FULL_45_34 TaxID=1798351 RepID=A0A1F5X1E7_9BACT|nr:MAG: hypothetical protein A2662_01510 [Candidatus Giovannonibacteria bacterium RIFCSPHIGHO2_01_FULL_45_33]OGF70708.1 MAG: hypothetical protein A3C73_02970 [Candidatus Giovannonibacteria bacterium RIFCSPHIGHO2_02_FULL_44_11]OGF81401.1 MAG: hypothetical protein A2930_01225 [Candidatus Giovannonibacteria bacterium RIFCSPLOWO2_01_FULL_45_34]
MAETVREENLPKKPKRKWLPFGEGVRRGVIVGAFLYFGWLFIIFLTHHFLDATEWSRTLTMYLLSTEKIVNLLTLRGIAVMAFSVAILFPGLWLLGNVPLKTVEDSIAKIWGKVFKKKKEKKFLFCVKLKDKSFFGGYPIGFVMQVVRREDDEINYYFLEKNKIYYHTWWPGLLHLTLPFVAADDVVILNIPVRAVLKIYFSAGAL